MDMDIELTNKAITKAIERCKEFASKESNIRLGITDGGCAGYEYVIKQTDNITSNDNILDYGKFKIVVDNISLPFLNGSILDYQREGLNEFFKIINPNEVSSCGCGVSIQLKI
tara:strand:- start:228 stop:566 length:339 start_codon:yes stop_codon:yes gene_type:complete